MLVTLARLESECAFIAYQGFDSLTLRQCNKVYFDDRQFLGRLAESGLLHQFAKLARGFRSFHRFKSCAFRSSPVRLAVRTQDFQSCNEGSTPSRDTYEVQYTIPQIRK